MARRSGLGKGLSALIPPPGGGGDRSSVLREVSIGAIRPNPRQPRVNFDEDTMSSLAASIRELGVLQPVLVRELGSAGSNDFELIAGERRWRAARRAGLQTIPVLVQTADDTHSLEQALVENLHRQDLNALEEAAAYEQLIEEFGYTHDQVAKRVGRSRAAVTNILRLLQLPAGAQHLLIDGEISAGHARALLGTPDRGYQEALAKAVVSEDLSVRAVEERIRRHDHREDASLQGGGIPAAPAVEEDDWVPEGTPVLAPSQPAPANSGPRRLPPPGILELEELLSRHLNTRVKVEMTAKRGRLTVDFATLEDLERIYRLMVGRSEADAVEA
ncbi:MAG: ParB/RepB/Spo0J family partition protein [Acidimicrobiales bacterium]